MSLQDEVAVLRRIPLFATMEPSKLKLLAFTSERVSFIAGQLLFSQGDEGDAAYVVIDGEAEILVDTPKGPVTVAKVERNAIIGEIAILCDVPRTATIKALTPLTTLRIKKAQFLQLLIEFPALSIEVLRVMGLRQARTNAELSVARSQLLERGA